MSCFLGGKRAPALGFPLRGFGTIYERDRGDRLKKKRGEMKEERGCELSSPGRFTEEPERAPSGLASRTKERGSPMGQEAFYGQGSLRGGVRGKVGWWLAAVSSGVCL